VGLLAIAKQTGAEFRDCRN